MMERSISFARSLAAFAFLTLVAMSLAGCSSPMEPVCLSPSVPDSTGAYYVAVHPAHWPHIDACQVDSGKPQ